jgi:hypothetical protein
MDLDAGFTFSLLTPLLDQLFNQRNVGRNILSHQSACPLQALLAGFDVEFAVPSDAQQKFRAGPDARAPSLLGREHDPSLIVDFAGKTEHSPLAFSHVPVSAFQGLSRLDTARARVRKVRMVGRTPEPGRRSRSWTRRWGT